ncbi:hypothetical protein SEA_LILMAC1015_77 [Arthrobacter phage Lilmac1015]|uniref:Uncharacterized protein n=1 Tax=Arthrobacter phage Lilmac1015 TaxID=2912653 RepID=A0AA49BNU3_9CAUD|nr:hypothetical protein SEA_LILMAC1015_77 [Arthrobacter phage Lilmac1015]
MSNPYADYSTSLLSYLADEKLVDVVRARLSAGTAVWGRGEFGPVLLRTEDDRPLLEIVHTPGEGDDFEASEALLAEAGL